MKTPLSRGVARALSACSSPPKPPEPTGQWVPVNQPVAQQSAVRNRNEEQDGIDNQTMVRVGDARATKGRIPHRVDRASRTRR